MANTLYSSLSSRIAQEVKDCPEYLITNLVRDTVIKICSEMSIWKYAVPKFNLIPGVFEYDFSTPTNTEVVQIIRAVVNNQVLKALTLEQAVDYYPEWADIYAGVDLETLWGGVPTSTLNDDTYNETPYDGDISYELEVKGAGMPQAICQVDLNRFIVLPLPDSNTEYSLRMFVSLRPTRDSISVNSDVFNEIRDLVIDYVLANLYKMKDVSWTDPNLSVVCLRQYTFKSGQLRAKANISAAKGSLRVEPAFFGA
jgi:hypothetical protein